MLMPRLSSANETRSTHDNYKNNSNSSNSFEAPSKNTTVAAHTKMRLLSKVEHNMRQQNQGHADGPLPHQNNNQSVKKLITTAATGNGVVGDVDCALLTPLRAKQQANGAHSGKDSRPERNLWSRAEMLEMLNIMQQINALELLNDRNVKSEHVFRQIEEIMHGKGYVKKSSVQIWTKWKFLKSTYNTTRRQGQATVPKVVPEQVYRALCRMLRSNDEDNSSECDNSAHSTEGTAEMAVQQLNLEDSMEHDEQLGVEHPIFGFRLGGIKPEPLDTGYESVANHDSCTSERDAMEYNQGADFDHTPFVLPVKNEPEIQLDCSINSASGANTPPPTAPTSPSPPPQRAGAMLSSELTSPKSLPVPPLRVAAFAKDAGKQPTSGILKIERPPPLTRQKNLRAVSQHTRSSDSFAHPTSKLMLPKLPPAAAKKQMPLRIPREISMMRLKQVPMRETPYSLRPERMIPDLDQSISPPQSPSPTPNDPVPTLLSRTQPPYDLYANAVASTSRQAQLQSQSQPAQLQRKRRMPDASQSSPVPVKLQRNMAAASVSTLLYKNNNSDMEQNKHNETDLHDGKGDDSQAKSSQLGAEALKRKQEEFFKNELSQFAAALHATQKEMMQDFFAQQKEFARQEHEFQLKQDTLVMRALRKQTNALLRTANDLMQQVREVEKLEPETIEDSMSIVEPEIELQEAQSFNSVAQAETLECELASTEDQNTVDENTQDSSASEGSQAAKESAASSDEATT